MFIKQKDSDIPQISSLTLEDGIFKGLNPAFVQWNFPLVQADVPEKHGMAELLQSDLWEKVLLKTISK